MSLPEMPMPGDVYLHYKGGRYQVVCVCADCDSGLPTVVYKSLSDHKTWCRLAFKFLSMVQDAEHSVPVRRYVLESRATGQQAGKPVA